MKLNLNLSNDFLFRRIMEKNPDLCKEFVELIIERKLGKIESIHNEKYLEVKIKGKKISLDIFFKTDDGIGVNLEMQNQKVFPEKRARYYQSMLDVEFAHDGEDYQDMLDTYIIVICTYDPFDKGLYKYTVSKHIIEDNTIKLNDGQHIIYLNTKGKNGNVSKELQNALKIIEDTTSSRLNGENSKIAKRLYDAREVIMKSEKEREVLFGSLMPLEMHISALKKAVKIEAYNEGLIHGEAKGKHEGRNEGRKEEQEKIIKTMRSKGFSDEEIKEYTGVDVKKK